MQRLLAIPRQRPRLLFERPVPCAYHFSQATPVVTADGTVLLSCGWDDRVGSEAPALVALDGISGLERFRLDVPVLRPGSTEGQVGLATLLPDGGIAVPVYQWDVALTVHWLDREGGAVRADPIGAEDELGALDLQAFDSGIKLFLSPLAVSEGAYLLSWVYRSRSHHLVCRELSTGAPRWDAPEWLVACHGGVAVGETDPPRVGRRPEGAEIRARSVASGAPCWSLPPERALDPPPSRQGAVVYDPRPVLRTALGLLGSRLLFVDRAARGVEMLRRDDELLEMASAEESADWDALEQRWEREHPRRAGDSVVAYDLSSGAEIWRHPVEGEVVSATCSPETASLVTCSGQGATLECLDAEGKRLGGSPLSLDVGTRRAAERAPRLVAADSELLLWARDAELVCQPIRELSRVLWRMPLPAPCPWVPPRFRDRDLRGAAITASGERLYLRDGDTVWAFG